MKVLEELLVEGVANQVFPAAEATVLSHGIEVFHGKAGDVSETSEFDLASLTKVLATTTAFMALWSEGRVTPETPVARYFPESPVAKFGGTLEDLLTHRAGLPGWKPFFLAALDAFPALLQTHAATQRELARRFVIECAAQTELVHPPRAQAVYSDVGFILLGEILAREAGVALDVLVESRVMTHLGLPLHYHRLSREDASHRAQALDTGAQRPREAAPGQEALLGEFLSIPSWPGEVDDDNAWAMDGVAGHAGLFGRSHGVARLGELILEDLRGAQKLASAEQWQRLLTRDATTVGSTRALGFDTPSAEHSSAGRRFGPASFGHLGFTGTSLWVDPARSLVVALLTNRVALGRANTSIRDFRPRFHDAVVQALGVA